MQSVNISITPSSSSPLPFNITPGISDLSIYKRVEVLESEAVAVWSVSKMVIHMTRFTLCEISETEIILKSSPSRLHTLNMIAYIGVGRPLS